MRPQPVPHGGPVAPPDQPLPLQVRDGLSYEEIAATLRLSVNTVRNHLAAARESLRRILEEVPE